MSEKNLWVIELEAWPCSPTMSHSCPPHTKPKANLHSHQSFAFTGVYSSRSSSRKSAPTQHFWLCLPSSCWEYFFLQNDCSWRKFVMFACAVYSQLLLSAIFLGHAASLCITHLICTMVVLSENCWMHQCFRQTGWKPPQVRKIPFHYWASCRFYGNAFCLCTKQLQDYETELFHIPFIFLSYSFLAFGIPLAHWPPGTLFLLRFEKSDLGGNYLSLQDVRREGL